MSGLAVALALFGWAGAVQDPRVVRYTITLAKLPLHTKPIRLVQLSDLHASWIDMPPVRIERIVDQVNDLHPDIIVLTGDFTGGKYFDWPHIRLETMIQPLNRLHAPLGVYAVAGNHDSVFWLRWAMARTHINLLVDRWMPTGPLTIAGADDLTQMDEPVGETRRTVADAPADRPLILLSHEPNFFIWMPPSVDLLIAGHTHGGQILFPLIGTATLDGYLDTHLRGVFHEHDQTMVVSSGLGTSGVPLRIGVPPEIVELTLVPAQPPGRKSGTDR